RRRVRPHDRDVGVARFADELKTRDPRTASVQSVTAWRVASTTGAGSGNQPSSWRRQIHFERHLALGPVQEQTQMIGRLDCDVREIVFPRVRLREKMGPTPQDEEPATRDERARGDRVERPALDLPSAEDPPLFDPRDCASLRVDALHPDDLRPATCPMAPRRLLLWVLGEIAEAADLHGPDPTGLDLSDRMP